MKGRVFPIVLFVLLACVLGWVQHIASALGAAIPADNMPLAPLVAAVITASVLGRSELKAWWRQLLRFRTPAGWYVLALLAPAVIISAAVLANHAFGAPLPSAAQLSGWKAVPLDFLAILLLVGIGEEAGWTAFAAPRLLDGRAPLAAWAILAAIRVLWHLPLMLSGQLSWVLGVGGNIAFQFLVVWIFARSGGAWSLAAIWHTGINALGGSFFFQLVRGADQQRLGLLMTLGYVVVAIVVLLADFRQMAARRPAIIPGTA
jgi:membrane protease YdiL (CAAX protease family)